MKTLQKLYGRFAQSDRIESIAFSAPMRRSTVRRLRRFAAGKTREDAIEAARQLNARGLFATLRWIPRLITSDAAVAMYAELAAMIRPNTATRLLVRLSDLGLDDPGMCSRYVREVTRHVPPESRLVFDIERPERMGDVVDLCAMFAQDDLPIGASVRVDDPDALLHARRLAAARVPVRVVHLPDPPPHHLGKPQPSLRTATVNVVEAATQAGGKVVCATHDEQLIDMLRSKQLGDSIEMHVGFANDAALALAHRGAAVWLMVPFGSDWYWYGLMCAAQEAVDGVWALPR